MTKLSKVHWHCITIENNKNIPKLPLKIAEIAIYITEYTTLTLCHCNVSPHRPAYKRVEIANFLNFTGGS